MKIVLKAQFGILKIEVELPIESEKYEQQETEEEQILNSVITRLNEI